MRYFEKINIHNILKLIISENGMDIWFLPVSQRYMPSLRLKRYVNKTFVDVKMYFKIW